MLRTGQRPGKGIYQCMECRHKVRLTKDEQALPCCSGCGVGKRVRWRQLH